MENTQMAEQTNASATVAAQKPEMATESRHIILKEIKAKWSNFTDAELSALKGRDDLVSQVVAKYSFDKANVQRDVDALLKGRQI
jgi:hypothetical protein